MKRNEKQTREELIDPKLQLAGWNVLDKKYVVEKGKACIETPVSGMPKTHENPSGNGFVDYTMISNQLEQFCEESGISKTVATEKIYRNILRNISVDWKKSAHFSNKNI